MNTVYKVLYVIISYFGITYNSYNNNSIKIKSIYLIFIHKKQKNVDENIYEYATLL